PNWQRAFFGISPQFAQVLLAPLTLEIADIRDLPIPAAQMRDISDKKYKMGGLFRVERAQDLAIELALELARRARRFTVRIKQWNLLRIRKWRSYTPRETAALGWQHSSMIEMGHAAPSSA